MSDTLYLLYWHVGGRGVVLLLFFVLVFPKHNASWINLIFPLSLVLWFHERILYSQRLLKIQKNLNPQILFKMVGEKPEMYYFWLYIIICKKIHIPYTDFQNPSVIIDDSKFIAFITWFFMYIFVQIIFLYIFHCFIWCTELSLYIIVMSVILCRNIKYLEVYAGVFSKTRKTVVGNYRIIYSLYKAQQ